MQIQQQFTLKTPRGNAERRHKRSFTAEHQFSNHRNCRSGSNERGAGACNEVAPLSSIPLEVVLDVPRAWNTPEPSPPSCQLKRVKSDLPKPTQAGAGLLLHPQLRKQKRALWRWIKKSFCRIFPLWVTVRLAVLQEEMREDVGLTPTGSAGMREGQRKRGSRTWNEGFFGTLRGWKTICKYYKPCGCPGICHLTPKGAREHLEDK